MSKLYMNDCKECFSNNGDIYITINPFSHEILTELLNFRAILVDELRNKSTEIEIKEDIWTSVRLANGCLPTILL